ncbi:uncharacterized protein ARB_02545 [Trichophyton benhamiae CBS 112371]|uniref:Uncharacterized protein n=1 Tax=Arthroderma benhamiae (strain ATCC MYA-4681 / CBS 112371) TaxID=663331 RepID=D4B262_ARTBC|nr:uncharacterized protein ARB_02545 [Trichophyton benhamiae CBS 112371]EFE30623.1 hypothetical protein ARB_02545 [Trichophyton benhamiae CBS 112371]
MKAAEPICDVFRRSRKIKLAEFRAKMVLLIAAALSTLAANAIAQAHDTSTNAGGHSRWKEEQMAAMKESKLALLVRNSINCWKLHSFFDSRSSYSEQYPEEDPEERTLVPCNKHASS